MIAGCVESVMPDHIGGWAACPEDEEDRLLVEIFAGDALIASVAADRAEAGAPHSGHRFLWHCTPPLPQQLLPQVEVYAVSLMGERAALTRGEPAAAACVAPDASPRRLVFSGAASDDTQRPVFILGAPRSGTTAMAQALLALPKYDGAEEGHLFDLAGDLRAAVHAHYQGIRKVRFSDGASTSAAQHSTAIDWTTPNYFEEAIRAIFVDLARTAFRSPHWIDKTPTAAAVTLAPLFRQIWPQARFIFMKRRAIENIASRLRKFPGERFADQCHGWVEPMFAWTRSRLELAGAAIEIDQLLAARDPQRAAAAVATLLALTDAEAARLSQLLAQRRPEQTSDSFGSVCDPAQLAWSEQDWETFGTVCGPMMREFSYDLSSRYYRDGCADRELVLV